MIQLSKPPNRRPRHRLPLPRLSADPDVRSTQIGVLGTILVHVLLFLLVPRLFRLDAPGNLLPRAEPAQEFNIELLQDEAALTAAETPAPTQFVEVNPDAPDNVPDNTVNFGAQNQQAAQEQESPDMSGDRPALEGQTEIQTTQIVSGQLSPQIPPLPSAPPVPEMEASESERAEQARREQTPLSGFEKDIGDAEDSYGSNIAKIGGPPDPDADKEVEGEPDTPVRDGIAARIPPINPNQPQPRPRLERRARPAIFTENKIGTANIGPTAVDARWSNYGQYLQQLIETVQIQWDRILIQSRVYPSSGTKVVVKFILNQKGEVARIIGVDGTAGEQGQRACVSAITARSPYGDWTSDMVAVLGEEQEMTFTFYYQ